MNFDLCDKMHCLGISSDVLITFLHQIFHFSIYWKEDVLFQLKIRDDSEKFKKPAAALIKAKICQFFVNIFEIYLVRLSL
jgi:hypothetical protein